MSTDYRAQAEAFAEFLLGLPKARRRVGDKITGRCPKSDHEDKSPSFSFNVVLDAWACSCGQGKGSELRKILGWTWAGADNGKPWSPPARTLVARYVYADLAGHPLFRVNKYSPKKPKGFDQERWDAERKSWVGGPGCMEGVPRVLYRYSDIAANPDKPLLIVEGEKDAETAVELGFLATTNPHGAGKWRDEYSASLAQRSGECIVIPDKDQVGKDHAAKVVESLLKHKLDARIVELPVEDGKDLTDWREAGGTPEALKALLSHKLDWMALAQAPQVPMSELAALLDTHIDYAIKPICPRGTLTLLQGQPKSGKSVFALYAAISAACGKWMAGMFEVERPLNVLLVEYEDNPILVVQRASRYLAGLGGDPRMLPPNLFLCDYPQLWIEQKKYKDLLVQEIKSHAYDLVVIDTLSYVHNAESEDKSTDMKPVIANLKRVAKESGCSILLIHHTSKGSKEKSIAERARGSSAIAAGADVILDWGNREKTNTTPVQFVSKYDDGYDFRVNYKPCADGSVEWTLEEAEETDPDSKKTQLIEAVRQLCLTSPDGVSGATLVRALPKWSERTIYLYIRICEKEGKLSVSTGARNNEKKVRLIDP